ncbi:MAG: GntR family transcriptional regulator [Bryobacteraceae bacterium]|nr:GntR family transcriptional regulator [Bryobacteraceae bacterium]
MIPFRVAFEPGSALHEQVLYAARKAIVGGKLAAGDAFPSVRTLARELKINPNTAHKVVERLTAEGLLEVMPGIGCVVAKAAAGSRSEKKRLLDREVEALVVEARRLGLGLEELQGAVEEHWMTLGGRK